MTTYATGQPGTAPLFLFGISADEVQAHLQPGEVMISVASIPTVPTVISANGLSIQVVPPTLDELKRARWDQASDVRDSKQNGGCLTPLGAVDTDPDSQRKISGAVLAAVIAKGAGAPFQIDWTMLDSSVVTHDADALISMGMAVTMYLAACQSVGTLIKDSIMSAADAAAVAAVDINAGYPSGSSVIIGPTTSG